ncbi:hypothetical protein SLE2022_032310 [Rubroshorea leprosula]
MPETSNGPSPMGFGYAMFLGVGGPRGIYVSVCNYMIYPFVFMGRPIKQDNSKELGRNKRSRAQKEAAEVGYVLALTSATHNYVEVSIGE